MKHTRASIAAKTAIKLQSGFCSSDLDPEVLAVDAARHAAQQQPAAAAAAAPPPGGGGGGGGAPAAAARQQLGAHDWPALERATASLPSAPPTSGSGGRPSQPRPAFPVFQPGAVGCPPAGGAPAGAGARKRGRPSKPGGKFVCPKCSTTLMQRTSLYAPAPARTAASGPSPARSSRRFARPGAAPSRAAMARCWQG